MASVWEKAVTDDPTVLLVMLALADWANDEGVCWPSIPAIAQKCRTSERTVQRILRNMQQSGFLEITIRRGRNHTNLYKLKVPTCQVLFKIEEVKGDICDIEKVTNGAEAPVKGDIAMSPEPPVKPEPSKKQPSKARVPDSFFLPDWVPVEDWHDWLEVRRKLGAPQTDRALRLNLNRLDEYRGRGHPPEKVLQLAIERGWRGLFEPKEHGNGNGKQITKAQQRERDRDQKWRAIASGSSPDELPASSGIGLRPGLERATNRAVDGPAKPRLLPDGNH